MDDRGDVDVGGAGCTRRVGCHFQEPFRPKKESFVMKEKGVEFAHECLSQPQQAKKVFDTAE